MLAYAPWQIMVTLMVMNYFAYGVLAIIAIVLGFFNYPYLNAIVLFLMLIVYVVAIPLNLNWSRRTYKVLIPWFFVHISFTILLYAWHYKQSGIVGNNDIVTHSFRDALYFSVTTWTTLGYGDFAPLPSMRLVTSIQALFGLCTIPVGFSLTWFMIQESTVPYTMAYQDKGDYDENGHIKESRPDFTEKKPNKLS